jgi:hypothetical protein
MILYRRCHLQYNIIYPDQKQIGVPILGQKEPELIKQGPVISERKDEVFDIKSMCFIWNGQTITCTSNDTSEIVESSNYFTIISKNRQDVSCLKFDDVTGFIFGMNTDVDKNGRMFEEIVGPNNWGLSS